MIDPERLAERLSRLPVTVARIEVALAHWAVASFTGGAGSMRPSGVVALSGDGCIGHGECVAFDVASQQRFAERAPGILRTRRGVVGALVGDFVDVADQPYLRAALEAAVIDLAMQQNGLSMAALAEHETGSARLSTVISFDAGGEGQEIEAGVLTPY